MRCSLQLIENCGLTHGSCKCSDQAEILYGDRYNMKDIKSTERQFLTATGDALMNYCLDP